MPISAADVQAFVAFGREQGPVEFKAAGPRTSGLLLAKVMRAMLAMANRRDGGVVVVGVKEVNSVPEIEGLSAPDTASWRHDHLADTVALHADPRLAFDTYPLEVDGRSVVIIEVREFEDVPVICKKHIRVNGVIEVREGGLYVRSNRKPESREVANYDEMRALMELATDKEHVRFLVRLNRLGYLPHVAPLQPAAAAVSGYEAERGGL